MQRHFGMTDRGGEESLRGMKMFVEAIDSWWALRPVTEIEKVSSTFTENMKSLKLPERLRNLSITPSDHRHMRWTTREAKESWWWSGRALKRWRRLARYEHAEEWWILHAQDAHKLYIHGTDKRWGCYCVGSQFNFFYCSISYLHLCLPNFKLSLYF